MGKRIMMRRSNTMLIATIMIVFTGYQVSEIINTCNSISDASKHKQAILHAQELEKVTGFRELKPSNFMFVQPHGKFGVDIGFDMLMVLDSSHKEILFSGISKNFTQDKVAVIVHMIPHNRTRTLLDNWKIAQDAVQNKIKSSTYFKADTIFSESDSTMLFNVESNDKSLTGVVKLFKRDTLLYEARGQCLSQYYEQYQEPLFKMIRSFQLFL